MSKYSKGSWNPVDGLTSSDDWMFAPEKNSEISDWRKVYERRKAKRSAAKMDSQD